jgi:transcriptional regulator with XRE-family HTH domain
VSRRITNLQIRAARALLGWSQTRLADESGISLITVKRLEASDDDLFGARYDTVVKVLDALESAGIDFLPQAGGSSHGVQLKGPPSG